MALQLAAFYQIRNCYFFRFCFFISPLATTFYFILFHHFTHCPYLSCGLFEDKVANFWCASNVAIKWRMIMSPGTLVKFSTLLTALGFLPAVVGLLHAGIMMETTNRNIDLETSKSKQVLCNPTVFLSLLPYALLTSSMSFFYFLFMCMKRRFCCLSCVWHFLCQVQAWTVLCTTGVSCSIMLLFSGLF